MISAAPARAAACRRLVLVVGRCPYLPQQALVQCLTARPTRGVLFPLARHVSVYGLLVETPAGNNFTPICCPAPATIRRSRARCDSLGISDPHPRVLTFGGWSTNFVWNTLPPHLKNSHVSREQFKSGLKTWLFFVQAYS